MPIDREKMLDNLSEAWSFRHDGQRHFMDSYDAIHRLILTAPEPEDVKRLVEKATLLSNSVYATPGLRQTTNNGEGCIVSTFRLDELAAALAPFLAGGKEPSK